MGRDNGGGGEGSGGGGVLKQVMLSYAYISIWIFLSFTVIVYNKYILDPKMYAWPFPISLTMIHMAFCSSLAFLLVRVLHLVAPPTSRSLYLSSVLPIGALYSLSLWFSNYAHIYLSPSPSSRCSRSSCPSPSTPSASSSTRSPSGPPRSTCSPSPSASLRSHRRRPPARRRRLRGNPPRPHPNPPRPQEHLPQPYYLPLLPP